MKKILLCLSLCAAMGISYSYGQSTASTSSGQNDNTLASRVKFNHESIDFGTTPLNKPVSVVFIFKNIGTTPLVIENARPSCGCTTPSYTQSPVLPGAEGKITATYNAAVAGQVSKTVSVKFQGIAQELDLHLTGKVSD